MGEEKGKGKRLGNYPFMSRNIIDSVARLRQENPNGLVNLWDMLMLRFRADHFMAASTLIGQVIMDLQGNKIPQPQSARVIDDNLDMLRKYFVELGLDFSAEHARHVNAHDLILQAIRTQDQRHLFRLQSALAELQQRMCDEMKARIYLQVSLDKSKYYGPSVPPFGQKVFDCFPSAIDDVAEAGNCLALDRNTAVVFHLMRVMEAGLKVLASELGIPYAPSWESYLKQITSVVDGDWKSKPATLKKRQPLYKDLAGDLQAIKISWRNPTMHIVKKYGSDESEQIYSSVKQFMIRLAEAGLSE